MDLEDLKIITKDSLTNDLTCDDQQEFIIFCTKEVIKLNEKYIEETLVKLEDIDNKDMRPMLWDELERYRGYIRKISNCL